MAATTTQHWLKSHVNTLSLWWYDMSRKLWQKVRCFKVQQDKGRTVTVIPRFSLQTVCFPSHHTSFSQCSLSRDTMQRLVVVSCSPASADREGKCLFLPLPASCPSLHPSVTSFLLSLSPPPPLPPSSLPPPSPSLSLLLAFPVLFTYMSELG